MAYTLWPTDWSSRRSHCHDKHVGCAMYVGCTPHLYCGYQIPQESLQRTNRPSSACHSHHYHLYIEFCWHRLVLCTKLSFDMSNKNDSANIAPLVCCSPTVMPQKAPVKELSHHCWDSLDHFSANRHLKAIFDVMIQFLLQFFWFLPCCMMIPLE